jgi:hypothetical protein
LLVFEQAVPKKPGIQRDWNLNMGWFTALCRNTGLMIHHVIKPLKKSDTQVLGKEVKEQKVSETTILRRTTIDEIEIKRGNND